MENNERFKVIYSEEAVKFLDRLKENVREKIIYNITKSKYVLDRSLFKKLENSEIWEFRTLYGKNSYRMLAFWDKTDGKTSLVIATHGFVKKTQKTPHKEIEKAENIRKEYFKSK